VIAPDHIGCGLSDKPDLNQYDYSMKRRVETWSSSRYLGVIENVTLVLHDWGG